MIQLRDAVTLAMTKLQTRRVRTIVTIIIASLLFGLIAFLLLVIQGSIDSVKRFSAGDLSERYLTMASYSPRIAPGDPSTPREVVTRSKELFAQMIIDKKAAAKKLGIEYDPSIEQKPTTLFYDDTEVLDTASPSAVKAYNEYIATRPSAMSVLDAKLSQYSPTKTYAMTDSQTPDGQIKMINKGVEEFDKAPQYPNSMGATDVSFGWTYVDQAVTQPFMLSDAQLKRQQNSHDIPVVAPITKVEEALGLARLAPSATTQQKLDRIKYVRDQAETVTFSTCYRNSASQAQIDSAIDIAKAQAKNKNNKAYQAPALIYGLPAGDACAPAVVLKDSRSAAEKSLSAKQDEFNQMFGQFIQPVQQKLTFRVVGLSPSPFGGDSLEGIAGLFTLIAGSTLDGQWVVPSQMYEAMPNKADYERYVSTSEKSDTMFHYDSARVIAEFGTAAETKKFYSEVGCGSMYCDSETNVNYFGSNSILLDEIKHEVTRSLGYAALVIGAIAAVIMLGMVGRVIGDSRRETAVFRAIGAKRNDIRLIYLTYTIMLSSIIAVVSLALGLVAALLMDRHVAPSVTVQAHLTYLFADDALTYSFVGLWWEGLGLLVAFIILMGVTGMLLPLSRNLARSPIKDMRDDT